MDQDAINLAKAIRERESKGDFNAVGDAGTSHGAYQFQEPTWKQYSKEILGIDNAPMSRENQNAVAYGKIKKWKDAGKTAGEIAAMWNAGENIGDRWTTNKGSTVINGQRIDYDTPQYVKDVMANYQKFKGGYNATPYSSGVILNTSGVQNATGTPTQPVEHKPSFSSNEPLMDEVRRRRGELSEINKSDQNLGSKILQHGGEIAGLAGSLANRTLSAIVPNFIERPIAGALEGAAGQIAKVPVVQKGIEKYGEFAKAHPEAAKNIGAVGNIAALYPQAKVLSGTINLEKNLIKGVYNKGVQALEKAGLKTATDEVADLVAPKMSKGEIIDAATSGKVKKTGLMGNITVEPSSKVKRAADAVRGIVDPSKTATENTHLIREAIKTEAEDLKARMIPHDHPIVFKELASKFNGIKKPIMISSDSQLNKAYDMVKKAALQFAKESGGMNSAQLDARKLFDDFIEKQFPNLYTSDKMTPMRAAIGDIRSVWNKFIGDGLPEGFGYQDSLAKQTSMYNALDGVATKVPAEVGTNLIQRATKNHPMIKGVLDKAVEGGALGTTMKVLGF